MKIIFSLFFFLFLLLSLEARPLQILKEISRPSSKEETGPQSEYYNFSSTLKRMETRKIMRRLDFLIEKLKVVYGLENESGLKPSITLFQNKKDYFEHIKHFNIQEVKYAGGYFNRAEQTIALYWQGSREATLAVLFHEVTHCYTLHTFKEIPQALNEGFSTYMETAALDPEKCSFGTLSPQYSPRFQSLCEKNQLISLPRFLNIKGYKMGTVHETFGEKEYAQSWALIWFCLHGSPEITADFKSYLREARLHPDPEGKKFLQRVVKNETDFRQKWIRTFQKKKGFKKSQIKKLVLD